MDDDRILERERLQIEHIRELEMEELIEEIEGTPSSSDDESNSHRDERRDSYGEFTFNTYLASMHTYLGEVEDTHNRIAFFDGGAVLKLPLFYLEGVVLFPAATLPLRVVHPRFIAAVERSLNQADVPCTVAVVRVHRDPTDGRIRFATIGTTAEIRQYRRLEDGSLNVVTHGQQRFHMRRRWIDVEGTPCAEIRIIEEDPPLRIPRDAFGQLASIRNLWSHSLAYLPSDASHARQHGYEDGNSDTESSSVTSFESDLSPTEKKMHRSAIYQSHLDDRMDESTSDEDEELSFESEPHLGASIMDKFERSPQPCHENKARSESVGLEARNDLVQGKQPRTGNAWKKGLGVASSKCSHRFPKAFWPLWVYRMYDSYCLAQRVADMWRKIIGVPSMDELVKKPDLLSFFIASKIPVSESIRQELLEIYGIPYRLQREIEILESFNCIRCKNCQTAIARRSDMLLMSSDGPLGAYVNPHGYVHEIMTLLKANGLALIGRPTKEYSWFPGYAWTNTTCATCESQMGWLFTATNKKLKPRAFWGIRSSQVADDMR